MRKPIRALGVVFLFTLALMVGCGSKQPEFEVLGINLDSATLDSVRKIHPTLDCSRASESGIGRLLPDYTECRLRDINVANIRSSLVVHINKAGIVAAISIYGEPYDGPFATWSKAMSEKYGPSIASERDELLWRGSNGKVTLTKIASGSAILFFHGVSWERDMEALKRNIDKGQKF